MSAFRLLRFIFLILMTRFTLTAQIAGSIDPTFAPSVTQPGGADGVTIGAESSATLLPGSWTPAPDSGAGQQHTFRLDLSAWPKRFLRLRAAVSPVVD